MTKSQMQATAKRIAARRIEERAAKRAATAAPKLTAAEQAAYDAARKLDANALEDAVLLLEAAADDARKTREAMLPALAGADAEAAREFLRDGAHKPTPQED